MEKMKPVGILGGLGPEASNKFCEFLIKYKKANIDQDNLNFIHYCNAKIPSRLDYISGRSSVSPIPEMVRTCKALEDLGANCIVIPCNTIHHLLPEIQKEISVPIIDMIQLLVRKIKLENPDIKKIGVLGTTLTIDLRLYERYLNLVGIEVIKLDRIPQEDLVMGPINKIKAGKKRTPRKLLMDAASKMIEAGADALILGCTEIPLVLSTKDFDIPVYDPMVICAKEIINYSENLNMESLFNRKISFPEPIKAVIEIGKDNNISENKNA